METLSVLRKLQRISGMLVFTWYSRHPGYTALAPGQPAAVRHWERGSRRRVQSSVGHGARQEVQPVMPWDDAFGEARLIWTKVWRFPMFFLEVPNDGNLDPARWITPVSGHFWAPRLLNEPGGHAQQARQCPWLLYGWWWSHHPKYPPIYSWYFSTCLYIYIYLDHLPDFVVCIFLTHSNHFWNESGKW